MINILIVEDDLKLNKLFSTVLTRNGFNAFSVEDGERALDILDQEHIDLIISDIMMPKMDGYELTRALREANYNLPILMVTAKEDFQDKKTGFKIGVDDYMVKPIDVNEMVLRVEALLRRAHIVSTRKISIGNTSLNYDSLTALIEDEELLLPQKEFLLIYKLLSYPNKIFTRQQLMDEIWGMDSNTDERTVDVHINRLRDRFKKSTGFEIVTIRGLGYKVVNKNGKI